MNNINRFMAVRTTAGEPETQVFYASKYAEATAIAFEKAQENPGSTWLIAVAVEEVA